MGLVKIPHPKNGGKNEHPFKAQQSSVPGSKDYPKNGALKTFTLGLQHAFAMSCATILVPLLTGLDVGVALCMAGVGTIIFHLCTRGKMPTFLGSSFAFIAALQAVVGNPDFGATKDEQTAAAMGGIIVAGAIYIVVALLIRLFGSKFIDKLFPPVVRGVGIAIIGLNLASAAINNIQSNNGFDMFSAGYYWSWILAAITLLTAIILSSYGKGMVKMSSIVIALGTGYVLSLILTLAGVLPEGIMNLGKVAEHGWFEVPHFVFPRFDMRAIGIIAPISIVTCVEHVGDVYANGAVVGKDFTKDPGLHKTMLGDGLATLVAGLFGGPANTTYSRKHRRPRRHRQLQPRNPQSRGPHRNRHLLPRQSDRRCRNRPELRPRRRLHRPLRNDLLGRSPHPRRRARRLHQEPQPLPRGSHARLSDGRSGHRRPRLLLLRYRSRYHRRYPPQPCSSRKEERSRREKASSRM